jgi:hypothetical protein
MTSSSRTSGSVSTGFIRRGRGVLLDAYDRATEAGNALVRLEEKEAKLRAELAESGLLGKLVAQIRIAGLSANVRLQRERVASAFREGGKAVIDAGVLDSRRADGSLDPSIVPLAADIDASLERVRAFRERAESSTPTSRGRGNHSRPPDRATRRNGG